MLIRIVPHTKPLNHRFWTIIYLLSMFIGLMIGPAYGNDTVHIKPMERIEYHDYLYEQWLRTDELRRKLHVKAQGKEKKTPFNSQPQVPDAEPTPYLAKEQERKRGAREFTSAPSATPRSVSLSLRRQDPRRGHHTPAPHPQSKRALHQTTSRQVRD